MGKTGTEFTFRPWRAYDGEPKMNEKEGLRMLNYSRRETMKWLGLGAASLGLGSLLRAEDTPAPAPGATAPGATTTGPSGPTTAPAAELNGAGFYRIPVGSLQVTLLSDGTFPLDRKSVV